MVDGQGSCSNAGGLHARWPRCSLGAPCGDTMWGHHVGAPCGGTMWRHHVGAPCGGTMWGHHVGARMHGTLWNLYPMGRLWWQTRWPCSRASSTTSRPLVLLMQPRQDCDPNITPNDPQRLIVAQARLHVLPLMLAVGWGGDQASNSDAGAMWASAQRSVAAISLEEPALLPCRLPYCNSTR